MGARGTWDPATVWVKGRWRRKKQGFQLDHQNKDTVHWIQVYRQLPDQTIDMFALLCFTLLVFFFLVSVNQSFSFKRSI